MFSRIIPILLVLLAAGSFYLVRRFHRFGIIQRLAQKHRLLSWLAAAAPILLLLAAAAIWTPYGPLIVWVHLIIFLALGDLIGLIIRKLARREKRNISGTVSLCLAVVYLAAGWFCAHHVFETHLELTTDKALPGGHLRIVATSDSHLGVTLDGQSFTKVMERIQATEPDLVVMVGDFVDDDSPKQDMLDACAAMGKLDTTYGVYYTYGNHDKGYFNYRDYTDDDLRRELAKNNVGILEDEVAELGQGAYLIGRQDRTAWDRVSAQSLTSGLDSSRYMIMLDHQPNDYDNEAASGADLVISGHTHGGHIFPAGLIGLIMGSNDRVYGHETRGDTDFYVTSGLSGWAIPFKTLCWSEYVVIDIVQET